MVNVEDAVIARLKTHGETFEILVDPQLSLELKRGEKVDFSELLAIDQIFKNSKTGERTSEQLINEIFGTNDVKEIAERIIKKGDVHLTSEQRKDILEEKRRGIVSLIARRSINPQTRTPHPPSRIDKAMNEAKVQIDMNKPVGEQVERVLKAIKPIIPIRFESIDLAIKIPAQYATNSYGALKEFGETKKEEWDKDGNLLSLVNIPAGLQDEFYGKINSLTHGEGEVKILKR
ncbi:MAG: ribosome assembly factor SBDS [Candidatus Altiarchaeales archaeon ex4484_2]|nr:MAG: ribosome assembly factor SBDS [Candidatus Altiarchaeales archaeon ex4484_2]